MTETNEKKVEKESEETKKSEPDEAAPLLSSLRQGH